MVGFQRNPQGHALLSGAPLEQLAAQAAVPTPAYFYDLDGIEQSAAAMVTALGSTQHLVAYALKANSAASVVRAVASTGAGTDVVSGAELRLALACGVAPDRIVMSGVAKHDDELKLGIASGIRALQLESVEEIERAAACARALGQPAQISLRINPSVTIDSHAHVATGHDAAKFGIHRDDLGAAWERLRAHSHWLTLVGLSTHVGSMLAQPEPYLQSARVLCDVVRSYMAQQGPLRFVDFGGGFGIDYGTGRVRPPADFAHAALQLLADEGLGQLGLVVEPGRSLVGPHGVVLASVLQGKRATHGHWALIDAGMNDLIRPALYTAPHRIEPVRTQPQAPSWRVVGPVCESADDFGSHPLGDPLPSRVVIRDTGAYGFVMASEYNGRPMPAEVFIQGGRVRNVSPSPGADAWVQRRLDA